MNCNCMVDVGVEHTLIIHFHSCSCMCSDFHMDGEWICIVLHAADETGANPSTENVE